jgi:dimethylaniline monooxygenase (N-oxide forming)
MHPPSKDIAAYLEAYAERFDLAKDIRCGYEVISVERDSRDENWLVTTRKLSTGDTATIAVGRVVVASGILNAKHEVHLKHEERFKGELIHSREFKDPAKYKGKRVMVVGIGSTGADTLVSLRQANVGKLYASHREQFWVVSIPLNPPLGSIASKKLI